MQKQKINNTNLIYFEYRTASSWCTCWCTRWCLDRAWTWRGRASPWRPCRPSTSPSHKPSTGMPPSTQISFFPSEVSPPPLLFSFFSLSLLLFSLNFYCLLIELSGLPRYARVNTIKTNLEAVVASLRSIGYKLQRTISLTFSSNNRVLTLSFAEDIKPKDYLELGHKQFGIDPDIPNLLVFAPGANLTGELLDRSGITPLLQSRS